MIPPKIALPFRASLETKAINSVVHRVYGRNGIVRDMRTVSTGGRNITLEIGTLTIQGAFVTLVAPRHFLIADTFGEGKAYLFAEYCHEARDCEFGLTKDVAVFDDINCLVIATVNLKGTVDKVVQKDIDSEYRFKDLDKLNEDIQALLSLMRTERKGHLTVTANTRKISFVVGDIVDYDGELDSLDVLLNTSTLAESVHYTIDADKIEIVKTDGEWEASPEYPLFFEFKVSLANKLIFDESVLMSLFKYWNPELSLHPDTKERLDQMEFSDLNTIATDPDEKGLYKIVNYHRRSGSRYLKSELMGDKDINGMYAQMHLTYYDKHGGITRSNVVNLTFDQTGKLKTKTYVLS